MMDNQDMIRYGILGFELPLVHALRYERNVGGCDFAVATQIR